MENFIQKIKELEERIQNLEKRKGIVIPENEYITLTQQSSTPPNPNTGKEIIYTGNGSVDPKNLPILLPETGYKHYFELASSMYRQAIINGNFDIWQRGTSFTVDGYTADRWYASKGTGGAFTVSQQSFTLGQTDVPNNPTYFLRFNQTTGASTAPYLEQRIESVETFANQKITVSFWAKVASGTLSVNVKAIQNFGTGGSPSSAVETLLGSKTIDTTWKRYIVTGTLPSISGKTLGSNNNDYLAIRLEFPTSSTFTFDVSQVMAHYGEVPLPFYPKSYEEELEVCQRFYQVFNFYARGSTVDTAYQTTSGEGIVVYLPVPMRGVPTIVDYSITKIGHIISTPSSNPPNIISVSNSTVEFSWYSTNAAYRNYAYRCNGWLKANAEL